MKSRFVKSFLIFSCLIILFKPDINFGQAYESAEIDSLKTLLYSADVDDNRNIDLHIEIANAYRNLNVDSLLYYASIANDLSEKTDYTKGLARSTYYKASYFNKTRDDEKALELFNKTIELYKSTSKDNEYLKALNLAGIIHEMRHDYDKALEFYMIGLTEAQALNFKLDEAFFNNNISIIYDFTGFDEKALMFVKKASSIFEDLGENYYYSYALINIGQYYIRQDKADSALLYLNEAKPILFKDKNYYGLTNLYTNLGNIYGDRGKTDSALYAYKLSLKYAESIDSADSDRQDRIANAHLNLAEQYFEQEEYIVSLDHYRIVKSIGTRSKSLYQLKSSSNGIFKIFLILGQKDSALYYHSLSRLYNDSLLEETHNEKIDQLNYDFQLEQEKTLMEKEKEFLIADRKNQRLSFFIIIGVLITLVIFLIFIGYFQRSIIYQSKLKQKNLALEKKQLQLNLDYKNKELATSVLHLIERNEFINQLSEKLQSTEDNLHTSTILDLIKEIERNTSGNLWKEFEKTYMEVHKDFHVALTSRYPQLTANDRKLCAFILMNMSSKEISSITYQTPQSIKIARYRLRKKLGLSRSDNLSAFLNQLESGAQT
jgi:tetratricopeptide (TPR) repeat protein